VPEAARDVLSSSHGQAAASASPAGAAVTHVVAGIAIRHDGRVLVAQRPEGRELAGYWEFPGGKREPGETRREALRRELAEELGLDVLQTEPLLRFTERRATRAVDLDFWLITAWRGTPVPLEFQAFAWLRPVQLPAQGLLPANHRLALQLWLHGCGLREARAGGASRLPASSRAGQGTPPSVRIIARGGACVVVSRPAADVPAQASVRRWAQVQHTAGRIVLFERGRNMSARQARRLGGHGLLHRLLRRGMAEVELLGRAAPDVADRRGGGRREPDAAGQRLAVRLRPTAPRRSSGMVDLRRGYALRLQWLSTAPAGS
jgi:mutator protein MutT